MIFHGEEDQRQAGARAAWQGDVGAGYYADGEVEQMIDPETRRKAKEIGAPGLVDIMDIVDLDPSYAALAFDEKMRIVVDHVHSEMNRKKVLRKFAGFKVLVIDEWLIDKPTTEQMHFPLELTAGYEKKPAANPAYANRLRRELESTDTAL